MAESGLTDQFGKTISREEIALLREEVSPIGAIHARPPFQGHIAFGMNPQRLISVLKGADAGNTLEWWTLLEEIEELFSHYSAALMKRKRQVTLLPITLEAIDEKDTQAKLHADLVQGWLDTEVLQQALYDVSDAVGKGVSMHEIIWEQTADYCRPSQLLYRPQRFFEFSYVDGQTVWLRTETGFQDLLPHKFLVHKHATKSGNIVRSSLGRMAVFLWMWGTFTWKDWAQFIQTYGLPVRLGKYGPGSSDDDRRALWRAVSSIAGDVAAIIPDSMQMEFITAADKAAGALVYEKRLAFINMEISKLVLGGTAGMDAIAGGHAVGKEHRAGEADVEKYDAGRLAHAINTQIIPAMVAFTYGPQKSYPRIQIGRPEEVPIKDVVDAVASLGAMGLKVKASEIRERLQLTAPEDGDEVIGGAPEPEPSPEIPKPAKPLPVDGFTQSPSWLAGLVSLHTPGVDDEYIAALTQRLSGDAAGAMAGLTGKVKAEFHAATDMKDLAARLHRLKLPDGEFAEAMARGMALAQVVGQYSLVAEMKGQR